MISYSNAPLNEMALAVQFGERVAFRPNCALSIYDEVKGELPTVELAERLTLAGLNAPPQLTFTEFSAPRWWFTSVGGERLLQLQDDAVAVNWRRRVAPGEKSPDPYPGFDMMKDWLSRSFAMWQKSMALPQLPSVATCNLHYDNVWVIDAETRFADIFAFWQHMGISGRQMGPELRWSIGLEGEALGPNPRVEINASVGVIQEPEQQRAARLAISAFANPGEPGLVAEALDQLHSHIHGFLEKLTTEKAREAWNV